MSSQTNNVVVTLLYADNDTRNITFEGVEEEDLANVPAKIKSINENAENAYENFYKTFISDSGAAVSKISECKAIFIEEEVIYGV